MKHLVPAICFALAMGAVAAEPAGFRKIVLTEDFHAEAAASGDIDNDGKPDVVYGPFWYAGPDFRTRHPIYPAEAFDPHKYSNNFMTAVADIESTAKVVRRNVRMALLRPSNSPRTLTGPIPSVHAVDGA